MPGALRSLPVRLLAAVAGGLALWCAFPPVGAGWMAVVGVALTTIASAGASAGRAALVGLASGLAFFLPLLPWLTVVGADAWLALSLLCAAWFSLMGVGVAWASRLPAAPVWIACIWVAQEALRGSVPFGGFPWGRLAFAQADTPFGHAAAWLGLAGTTFAVALVGACLAWILVRRRWIAGALLAVLVAWLLPVATLGTSGTAVVAAVQGGTPQTGMGAFDVRRAVLDGHVAQTLALAQEVDAGTAPQPAFVLWPENASDIDPFTDPAAAAAISAAARAVGAPILVGAVVDAPDPTRVWNTGVVWSPTTGPGERYVKTHPVPFGEYIPFRDQLAGLTDRFDRIARDFAAGDTPGHLVIGGVPIGDVICFEIAYDDVMDALMREPGRTQLITVQTNNATYNGTAQPQQQLEITRMRALETGRTVLVAATSGISARITPDGAVRDAIGERATGSIDASIPLTSEAPLSSLLGRPLLWILTVAGIVAALLGSRRPAPGARSDVPLRVSS